MRPRPHCTEEAIGMGEMKEFAGIYYREGALDPKTMQLVALAAMAAAGCTS
jgi:alkylhydroperoxidase/carboxymuconolactone decarboxylase family protein YurZ